MLHLKGIPGLGQTGLPQKIRNQESCRRTHADSIIYKYTHFDP
jgi:hypothetical protein